MRGRPTSSISASSPCHRRRGIALKLVRRMEEWSTEECAYMATEKDPVTSTPSSPTHPPSLRCPVRWEGAGPFLADPRASWAVASVWN
ncbi:hypothetical protein OPV22_021838 [Ensete ventricosum]|uniref:N-acetyltransferase domain-containing protein n=1 Tax=Ensete ventricosum TaxID=4639 RepID=A0AAV8PDG5_ENSVE|nr:hypothetical protein OPV22_035131 [Ensete ventricosum]KAJ8455465.1 hypothetical protein OPV22_035132 [Ensete ventricosum]KAJ8478110.1 hypothetical protein OPV22_021837 [Ensete ventricosum]KAJ8478111.1 hypothetical protein OPV22_021838 [Ensete ventricosum]